jgi:mono/diheme cytochrome c family protein
MFALTEAQLKTISDFLKSNPQEPPPPRQLLPAGRQLYNKLGCIQCHNGQGPGPLLQIGYPFLNQKYFTERVRQGKGAMPAYSQLSSTEIKALYAYISLSPQLLTPEPQSLAMPLASGAKLYHYVMRSLSASGCIHCHGAGPHSGEEVARIFGTAPQNFFMTANSIDSRSRPALESKPDCQDSVLVERLEWRLVEQTGNGAPQRGMPLTGEPLSPATISAIRQWSRLGCPNGKAFLCTPCRTGQS